MKKAPAKASTTRKVGRDATTGTFKSVKAAQADKRGSVVETVKIPAKKKPGKKKR